MTNSSGSLWEMAVRGKSIYCMKTAQEKNPHSTCRYLKFSGLDRKFSICFFILILPRNIHFDAEFKIVITQYYIAFPLVFLLKVMQHLLKVCSTESDVQFPHLYNFSNPIIFRRKYECVCRGNLKTRFIHSW